MIIIINFIYRPLFKKQLQSASQELKTKNCRQETKQFKSYTTVGENIIAKVLHLVILSIFGPAYSRDGGKTALHTLKGMRETA